LSSPTVSPSPFVQLLRLLIFIGLTIALSFLMPGTTMASGPGIKTPPYCFCFQPAIELHTEEGLVYECHYTNIGLWLEHKGSESGSSSKLSTEASPQSSPTSQPSPVPNTAKGQSAHVHHPDIPGVVQALAQIQQSLQIQASQHIKNVGSGSLGGSGSDSKKFGQPSTLSTLSTSTLPTPPKKSNPPSLPLPVNDSQMIVCGFHMHTCLWEYFQRLVRDQEFSFRSGTPRSTRTGERQDAILARQHHKVVLQHPDFHNRLASQAEKSTCATNTKTFRRWVNGYEGVNGKTSPSGGAPICFCGTRMKLSSTHHGELNIAYFCAGRLMDAKSGCSRVMKAERWVQWQALEPTHPLSSTQATAMSDTIDTEDDSGTDMDDHPNPIISQAPRNGSWWDRQSEETDTWGDDSEELEEDQSITPDVQAHYDTEEPWDRYADKGSSLKELQTLPLLAGLVTVGSGSEETIIRVNHSREAGVRFRRSDEQSVSMGQDRYGHTLHGHGYRQGAEGDSHPPQGHEDDPRSGCTLGYWSKDSHSMVPTRMSREYSIGQRLELFQGRLNELHDLSPEKSQANKDLQELEARLGRWRESYVRLSDYKRTLCEEGLDNPTLRCRRCKEGSLLHVNIPCYHLVMCDHCIQEYPRCVVCNATISATRRTFWG